MKFGILIRLCLEGMKDFSVFKASMRDPFFSHQFISLGNEKDDTFSVFLALS